MGKNQSMGMQVQPTDDDWQVKSFFSKVKYFEINKPLGKKHYEEKKIWNKSKNWISKN